MAAQSSSTSLSKPTPLHITRVTLCPQQILYRVHLQLNIPADLADLTSQPLCKLGVTRKQLMVTCWNWPRTRWIGCVRICATLR